MDNKILVNNIKKLCLENNISISTLEKEMFMSPGLISRWTKNTPALDRIMEIANYFHVSLDSLVEGTNDENNNNNQNVDRLLSILYNKTRDAEVVWRIYDTKNTENDAVSKKIASVINSKSMDCFYCNVNNGNFILMVNYINEEYDLSLYVLADQYSEPVKKCSGNEKLYKLYDYLSKLYFDQLNNIKTENFIDDFINQSSSISQNNKITLLKSVVNE